MKLRPFLLLGLVAANAWALPPVSLSLGYSAQVFTGRSYDLVSGNDTLASVRLGAGYSFLLPRGALDVEASFTAGGAGDTVHNNIAASIDLKGLEAGLSYRYPLFAHLQPYLHLGAGVDWATLTLFDATRLAQTVAVGSGNAMLGAQIPFKLGPNDSRAPTMLMDLGVGYVLRAGAGFHAMAPGPADKPVEDPIAHASTNLGTLPLSGIQYRVLMTFRL